MNEIGFLLADNSRQARWTFDQHVREIGVTGPQARLILLIHRFPGETQGAYAERLEVEAITLCRMIDRLEEAELVERRRDPADRRAWRLHLTESSHAILPRLKHAVDRMVAIMLDGLEDSERLEFQRLLAIISANLASQRDSLRAANG